MLRPLIVNFFSTVQLTRLTHAFAGVANLWFVVLWTRAMDLEHQPDVLLDLPLWILLALAAVLGVGLSAYGGALNDVFDARVDQAFAPGRPIPAGRIAPQTATIIGFASLLAAMLAATVLGQTVLLMTLFVAAAILFYNTMARHIPSLGLVIIGAIYSGHMLILNLGMRFIWPILLVMIHAVVVYAIVYRLEEKRPKQTPMTFVGVALGLTVLTVFLFAQTGAEGTRSDLIYDWPGMTWPLAAVILFTVSSVHKIRFASSKSFAAEKLQRYGSLWMGVYGICWLLGGGLYQEAMILSALVALAVIWMMVVRDVGAWIEQPIGYRW